MKFRKINKIPVLFALFLRTLSGFSQDVPAPAPAQKNAILLSGATIHLGTGATIQNASILFEDGKIKGVGAIISKPPGVEEINCSGKHIYPGLILLNTTLGIDEIEAVRSTDDVQETGEINPNARSLVAYNTDSRVTPTVRSNGILLAQVVPQGGLISGTSSVMQLDAWNWMDAAYLADDGIHLWWPSLSYQNHPDSKSIDDQKKEMNEKVEKIESAFSQAESYWRSKSAGNKIATDLRWEAMMPVFDKKKQVYIHATTEKEITAAVSFALKHNLKMVLVGGGECWRTISLLKTHNIPVVLQETHALPMREDDDIDLPYRLPSILQKEGIKFCLTKGAFWDSRNLPFQAGTAVAHGLSKEDALKAITLNAAEILGIADKAGSLEAGKDANILVCEGDLLDMRTSKVEIAFIQGRKIDLGNKQKDLYEKFRGR